MGYCEWPGCDQALHETGRTPVAVEMHGRTLQGWACSVLHAKDLDAAWRAWVDRLQSGNDTPESGAPVDEAPRIRPRAVVELLAVAFGGAVLGRALVNVGYVAGFLDGTAARPLPLGPEPTP